MATDVSICNNALLLIGANTITTLSDNVNEAVTCNALYAGTRNSLIQEGKWTFCLSVEDLTSSKADSDIDDYSYMFTIPSTVFRVFNKDDIPNNYTIYGSKIYTNDTTCKVYCLKDPGEANYPDHFVRSLELKMASLLAAALENDESMNQLFDKLHTDALRKSRRIDGQTNPNLALSDFIIAPRDIRFTDNG